MSVRRKNSNGRNMLLFIFTTENCFTKRLILYPREEMKVELEDAPDLWEMHLVTIRQEEEGFCINGNMIADGGYFFLQSKHQKKIMIVPVYVKDTFPGCGGIAFTKEKLVIGSGFGQGIFYEYASFAREEIGTVYKERNGYFFENGQQRENCGGVSVYVNGQAVSKRKLLLQGDIITFMGLSVLVLKDFLLCTSFFGKLKIQDAENAINGQGKIQVVREGYKPEFRAEVLTESKEALHKEEVELIPPEPMQRNVREPLLLAIGPSATTMLPIILMSALGSVTGQNSYYFITMVMTVASASLAVFWGLVNHGYRRYLAKCEEKHRIEDYQHYLQELKTFLDKCLEENRAILLQKNPHYSQFLSVNQEAVKIRKNRSGNEEEKFVRLGLGEIPFQVTVKYQERKMGVIRDELLLEADALCSSYQKINNVPVGVFLGKGQNIGFAGKEIFPILLQFLLQLAAGYEPRELKIAFFYHHGYLWEDKLAECLKWLPHIWSEDKRTRFLAGNEKEAGEISSVVEGLLRKQQNEHGREHFVLLITNHQALAGEGLEEYLRFSKDNIPVTACYVSKDEEGLPGNCRYVVSQGKNQISDFTGEDIRHQKVDLECASMEEAEQYMRKLSGSRRTFEGNSSMNRQVSFLDLYDCDRTEDLGCLQRWQENLTGERMRVPIGMGEGGRKIYLDIHEKMHGPHGLVAGTTGAGKSELLQTYLLSLAVSFGPEDVSFFIIDYKGGGMGNVLSELPHCAGVVSNLSGRQIHRALLSIKSENLRRQMLLSRYKVSHIEEYKELYREGEASEPMPHLLLVVDEFAELKKEEPQFMQEIISISQVGRSLGVHLILATQKPAGCVDDKIWSNTRFRLCLRVADKQDSMDMLHRAEAAYLAGAGKGYLQIGNNELFVLFQAGYCKAAYFPERRSKEETALLSVTGQRLVMQKDKNKKQKKQLECVMEYLREVTKAGEFKPARALWMPELPEKIKLREILPEGNGICMGLCDDPGRQKQYPVFYRPEEDGHLCLCAGPATGKSTFLQTLLWQICTEYTPVEARFLLAASDAAGVNCFQEMPHFLGGMQDGREGESFFYHLEQFLEQRKTLLGGIHLSQYQKRQSQKIPIIFFIIDNYGSFRRITGDAYEALIEKIAAEGLSYGVYLILTASGIGGGEIPVKLFEKIKTTLTLQLSERVMYGDVMRKYHIGILPREDCKGRGLCRMNEDILEMQVPLFCEADDYGRIEAVREEGREKSISASFSRFPCIPYAGTYEEMVIGMLKGQGKEVPLGYVRPSAEIEKLPLRKGMGFVITGGTGSGKRSLLSALIFGCMAQKIQVILFDKRQEICVGEGDVRRINNVEEWRLLRKSLQSGHEKAEQESSLPVREMPVFAIGNLMDFIREFPYEEDMPPMLVLSRPGDELTMMGNPWFEHLSAGQLGICLGGNAGSQRLLRFEDLSYEQMSRSKPPGEGYLKQGEGNPAKILFIPKLSGKENHDAGAQRGECG